MKPIEDYKLSVDSIIRKAIQKLDKGGIGFIVIVDDEDIVKGVVSNGDFRRAVLNGVDLNTSIEGIINKDFMSLSPGYSEEDVKSLFSTTVVQHIPVIENGRLLDIITEEKFYNIKQSTIGINKLDLPVVIMAGGKGTRLDPFTRILPKPLIPIGNKPVIEVIMDEYAKFGINEFVISVNHKSRMIKAYFEEHKSGYKISYIEESKQLGTAGSLKLVQGHYATPFFVSNCDIIIKDDYCEIFEYHKRGKFDITIVASMQHYVIPYGVCHIENKGILTKIEEKPEYDFLVNTGMYLLNPDVLEYIPDDTFYHITTLINDLQKINKKIGVYPVSQKSYVDVGQWEEYKDALKKLVV